MTDALEKTTSVHDANGPYLQALHVLADASHEEIQEALNILVRKNSEHIGLQEKLFLKNTT